MNDEARQKIALFRYGIIIWYFMKILIVGIQMNEKLM